MSVNSWYYSIVYGLSEVLRGWFSKTSEATSAAAVSCIAGIACEYVSSVIVTEACPRRSETTFGWTPAASASVAWVCLRSEEADTRQLRRLRVTLERVRETVRVNR